MVIFTGVSPSATATRSASAMRPLDSQSATSFSMLLTRSEVSCTLRLSSSSCLRSSRWLSPSALEWPRSAMLSAVELST